MRRLKARLEIADAAVIFDAVDRKGMRRKAEPGEDIGAVLPLEGDVVDCHQARNGGAFSIAQIGGKQARLPVMDMHEIRPPAFHAAERYLRAGASKGCERSEDTSATPVTNAKLVCRLQLEETKTLNKRPIIKQQNTN